jgi:uncharacterized protein (TIGR03437 family)
MRRLPAGLLPAFLSLCVVLPLLAATTVTVDSKANIFAAGRSSTAPMDGALPTSFSFSSGPGKVLTIQAATGTVQCGPIPPWSTNGPDGLAYASDIASYNNISGIVHPRKSFFLVGVFLTNSLPATAPARLTFNDDAFTSFSPAIGQTFFIGDGLTGTGVGAMQQFVVPAEATRLFLGFADASTFRGNPGAYFDNSGSFTVTFNVAASGTCSYRLNASSVQMLTGGGAGTVSVSSPSGCPWTATSNANWLTIQAGTSGTTSGTISYAVAVNSGATSRTGVITVSGQTFTVTQHGAGGGQGIVLEVPSSSNLYAAGRTATSPMDGTLPPSYSFTAGPGKVLTIQSVTGTVQCGPSPTWTPNGPDGLNYACDINSYNNISGIAHPRKSFFLTGVFLTGSLPAAAPARFNFLGDDFPGLSPVIGQTFFIGDGLTGTGTGTQQQFFVPAEATRLFLGYADASYFKGNPGAYFDNSGSLTATFNISVGAACTYTLSAMGAQAPAGAASGSIIVNTASGCSWTATSNVSWITITSGASGTGSATVSISVTANTSTAARTGTLTIAGQTFTVTQSGAAISCEYSISPGSASVAAGASSGTVSVTATSGCSWTATSNANWITITTGASGTGIGNVAYSVAANTGTSSRTGTLTIAGKTFPLTQAGATPVEVPVISSGGILNAADYAAIVAPGGMMAIFGTKLAPATRTAPSVPLPNSLEGVTVEVVDGDRTLNAALFFVSPNQINAQVPFEIASASVQVRVRTAGGVSNAEAVAVAKRAPRLFTKSQDGRGEPVLLHANFTFVSSDSPAQPRETLIMYVTGLGAVSPALATSKPGGDGGGLGPLNVVVPPVTVKIGDRTVQAAFAGMAPYFVGVYQLNFVVPADVSDGWQRIEVSCEEEFSQPNVSFPIRALPLPLASVAVGTEGKTVAVGNLLVMIPSGTLSAPATLQVAEVPVPAGQGQTTNGYTLEGLPSTLNAPIEITIDIGAPPSGDGQPYIILDSFVDGGPQLGTKLLPAKVEGSRVTATLPAGSLDALLPAPPQTARFGPAHLAASNGPAADGWTGRITRFAEFLMMTQRSTPASSFVMYYPRGFGFSDAMIDKRLEHLEAARGIIEGTIGLAYGPRLTWNPQVLLRPAPFATYRGSSEWDTHQAAWTNKDYAVVLNSAWVSNDADLRFLDMSAGHALFHRYQDSYPITGKPLHWVWVEEAASTWFQRFYAQGGPESRYQAADYIASSTRENFDFLLLGGLDFSIYDDRPYAYSFYQTWARARGTGAAMFMHYLVKKQSNMTIIRDIFQTRQRSGDPLATLHALTGNLGQAWREFCKEWMAGNVYSNEVFPPVGWVVSRAERPRLEAGGGGGGVGMSFPDRLSASLFEVAIPRTWPPDEKLSMSTMTTPTEAGPESETLVYSYLPGTPPTWKFLNTFKETTEIDAAGKMGRDGVRLYALNSAGYWSGQDKSGVFSLFVGLPSIMDELKKSTSISVSVEGKFVCDSEIPNWPCTTLIETLYPNTSAGKTWQWEGFSLDTQETHYNSNRTVTYQTGIFTRFDYTGRTLLKANVFESQSSSGSELRFYLTLTNLRYTGRLESDKTVTHMFELTGPAAKSDLKVDWALSDVGKPPRATITEVDATSTATPLRLTVGLSRPK